MTKTSWAFWRIFVFAWTLIICRLEVESLFNLADFLLHIVGSPDGLDPWGREKDELFFFNVKNGFLISSYNFLNLFLIQFYMWYDLIGPRDTCDRLCCHLTLTFFGHKGQNPNGPKLKGNGSKLSNIKKQNQNQSNLNDVF